MPSRADSVIGAANTGQLATDGVLRAIGMALHAVALVCVALLLWSLTRDAGPRHMQVAVSGRGTLDTPLHLLLRSGADTVDMSLATAPDARVRAMIRALRGSGRVVQLTAPAPLSPLALSAEEEWRATGGARVQIVGSDSAAARVEDAAGLLDSVRMSGSGARLSPGPLNGVLRAGEQAAAASVAPLAPMAPTSARVLVLGTATWESRFLVAALEEAGWPLDVAVSLSPKVTVTQGALRIPSRARHEVVVVLPGATPSAVALLPRFVRDGGGLVIVGEAARIPALAALRVGAPGVTVPGDPGAETSDEPRRGLDVVPIGTPVESGVILEWRERRPTVAARRVGAGRVIQVGYDNSWLWRMAGNDDAPVAHRRWWTSLLSGVVALRSPMPRVVLVGEADTLDASPVAAMARDIGMPVLRAAPVTALAGSLAPRFDLRWLFALATGAIVASWLLRRWRGLV